MINIQSLKKHLKFNKYKDVYELYHSCGIYVELSVLIEFTNNNVGHPKHIEKLTKNLKNYLEVMETNSDFIIIDFLSKYYVNNPYSSRRESSTLQETMMNVLFHDLYINHQ